MVPDLFQFLQSSFLFFDRYIWMASAKNFQALQSAGVFSGAIILRKYTHTDSESIIMVNGCSVSDGIFSLFFGLWR